MTLSNKDQQILNLQQELQASRNETVKAKEDGLQNYLEVNFFTLNKSMNELKDMHKESDEEILKIKNNQNVIKEELHIYKIGCDVCKKDVEVLKPLTALLKYRWLSYLCGLGLGLTLLKTFTSFLKIFNYHVVIKL